MGAEIVAAAGIASQLYGAYTDKKASKEAKKQANLAEEELAIAEAEASRIDEAAKKAKGASYSAALSTDNSNRSVYSSLLGGN